MIHGDTSSTRFGSVNNLLVQKEGRGGGQTTRFISFCQDVKGFCGECVSLRGYVTQMWKRAAEADNVLSFYAFQAYALLLLSMHKSEKQKSALVPLKHLN